MEIFHPLSVCPFKLGGYGGGGHHDAVWNVPAARLYDKVVVVAVVVEIVVAAVGDFGRQLRRHGLKKTAAPILWCAQIVTVPNGLLFMNSASPQYTQTPQPPYPRTLRGAQTVEVLLILKVQLISRWRHYFDAFLRVQHIRSKVTIHSTRHYIVSQRPSSLLI